jgi:AraC-like DNA-binding protein
MLSVSNGSNRNASFGNKVAYAHVQQPWFILNSAKHYDLAISDDPIVSHCYAFEADLSGGSTFAIPDGCIDILFDCDQTNPEAKVCGSTLEARSAGLKHGHRYFGVRYELGVIPGFLGASADELVNCELNLLDIAPRFEPVFSQIVTENRFEGQVKLFRRLHSGKAPRTLSVLTLEAVRAICDAKGDLRIKQLEKITGYTCRTLQRQFQNDMGMSPKILSRIVRCQSAVHEINCQGSIVFSELACDLGFSDQPHFLREFKKFVSATPVNYQRQVQQSAYLQRIRYAWA